MKRLRKNAPRFANPLLGIVCLALAVGVALGGLHTVSSLQKESYLPRDVVVWLLSINTVFMTIGILGSFFLG